MNVREFCRAPGYRSAVLLTYSFDAGFFERVVLPDLRAGGTGVVAVIADRREVEASIDRWQGIARQLGRRYVLDTAGIPGRFHPKVILRTGPKGGAIWVGTGNVTPSGWGANRELATHWKIGPGEPDDGAWTSALLDQVALWAGSPLVRDAVVRMREDPWIADATGDRSANAPLWSSPSSTLADQLGRRWAGRRFSSLRVTTGSTDASGEFLSWAYRTFGIQVATVAVHAESATFDPRTIEKLPFRVEFIEPTGPKPLHAKCYWFDGPDGPAAIVGSANCSASAWVRPTSVGGNVELVVVADSPDPDAWRPVLTVFDGPTSNAREHLRERPREPESASASAPYGLLSVQLDVETGRISARFAPEPAPEARVTLLVGHEELAVGRVATGSDMRWDGPRPEAPASARSLFATARIETATGTSVTAARWIDVPQELRVASQDRRVSAALLRLLDPADTSEQRRIAEDLHLAMDAILTDRSEFQDAPVRRLREQLKDATDGTTSRLDPRHVAVAFRTADPREDRFGHGASGLSLSLTGVFDALFAVEQEVETSVDVAAIGDEGEEAPRPSPPDDESVVAAPRKPPPDHLRKRLAKQMESFLSRLQEPAFANACTATQLVHAATFPMALAALGMRSGWVDSGVGQHWAISAVTALLHEPIDGSPYEGLLSGVRARYEAEGRRDVFESVVDNGLLWAVTATVLAGFEWSGPGGRIRRGLLLRDVFRREELVAGVTPQELRALAGRFRGGDAVATIADELPRVDAALEALEAWLSVNFASLLQTQAKSGRSHELGDPLWRPIYGWVFASESAPISSTGNVVAEPWRPGQFFGRSGPIRVRAAGFYVNVRCALEGAGSGVPSLP